jgi:hypothetical protein
MGDDPSPARLFAAGVGLIQMAFGVSLFLDPYRWARVFRWRPEPQTDVGLYFGRCLGALAIGAGLEGLQAARDPEGRGSWFRFTEAGAWLLAAVHVRGLLEHRQPLSETAEIPGWVAMATGARRFAPSRYRTPSAERVA